MLLVVIALLAVAVNGFAFTCDPTCTGCGGTHALTPGSTISIPNPYAQNLNCTYTVVSSNFVSILSSVNSIKLGADFLIINDIGDGNTRLLVSLTGNPSGNTYYSMTNTVRITFLSGTQAGSNTGALLTLNPSATDYAANNLDYDPTAICFIGEPCPPPPFTLRLAMYLGSFNYPGMDLSSAVTYSALGTIRPLSGFSMVDGASNQLIFYEGPGHLKPFAANGPHLSNTNGVIYVRDSVTTVTARYLAKPWSPTKVDSALVESWGWSFDEPPSSPLIRHQYLLMSDSLPPATPTTVKATSFYRGRSFTNDRQFGGLSSTNYPLSQTTTTVINDDNCPCFPGVIDLSLSFLFLHTGDTLTVTDSAGFNWVATSTFSSGTTNNITHFGLSAPVTLIFQTDGTDQFNPFEFSYSGACIPCTHSFGDPHFVGLAGQRFKVQGPAGFFYNIYSSATTQMNALWIVSEGEHNFVVNGEIGLRVNDDYVFVSRWAHLRLNGKPVPQTEDRVYFDNGNSYIQRDPKGTAGETGPTIVTPEFIIKLIPRKYEIDIQNFTLVIEPHSGVHGLLGQTWNDTLWPQKYYTVELTDQKELFEILDGELADYVVRDGLFGTEFGFNQFNQEAVAAPRELTPRISEFWNFPVRTFQEALEDYNARN